MAKKMASGSGLCSIVFNRDDKQISFDFSGNDNNGDCYRNDASILFFSANSYKSAFLCLDRELVSRFENNTEKCVGHLILPYYFNFRHYVELSLKALFVALTDESPTITHDLNILSSDVKKSIDKLQFDAKTPKLFLTQEKFVISKKESSSLCDDLIVLIQKYGKLECVVEYYRYIFEKEKGDLCLKNSTINLDYSEVHSLFIKTRDTIDKLCLKLREIHYIYFSL